ncbi:MAG: response regulator [Proteobacteria bacterium]|nr:response regulator [Pseudomonadota bacterium]MBS0573657.1 response regulator [Pseudomonadota bacterium]
MTFEPLGRTADRIAPRAIYLAGTAAALCLAGWAIPSVPPLVAYAVAGAMAAAAGLIALIARRPSGGRDGLGAQLAGFIDHDAAPSFTTDAEGAIRFQNRAAVERFGTRGGQTLTRVLGEVFASPAAILHRLQTRAEATGVAHEDLVTRRGHVRLAAHHLDRTGILWRLEEMAERAAGGRGAESISLPMLTVSKSGTILFMNEALRRVIGERVRTLDRIFVDLPVRPGEEQDITAASGRLRVLVADVESAGGRREIFLLPASGRPGAPPRDPTAFDHLPVALLRLSARGELRQLNRAARALIGEPAEGSALGAMFEGLGRPVQDWLADALAGRTENRPEVLRLRSEAEDRYFQVMLSRTLEDGQPGLMATLTDATRMKSLEAQFVQSQKMQAIGQLAGGVAHDFNNLLTAISGHCDLLLLRHDKSDADYADLIQVSQNANRAASLVGQLLAFSRKQTLKPATLDLRDTLSDLTHLLNRLVGERTELSLAHDPALRPIRADKRQLEQVIMNLVVNARDAMPGGGHIQISTENAHLGSDLRRDRATVPAGDYVVVRVADQGEGIGPERIDKIFEPFYTTKRPGEGTGLGLSMAYGIVKQTGGFIFCDSVPGQGTTFSLFFPAHEAAGEEAAEPAPDAPQPRRAARIGEGVVLLVEDEAPVRAFASRALKMRGFTVIEAENAEEALRLLADRALAVDVFVTDVIMPGMDGPTWVREALKERPDTRVVFVSGYSEESLSEDRDRIPNSVFLPKPFSLGELTATVQNQLH